jgi:hypothetical protein
VLLLAACAHGPKGPAKCPDPPVCLTTPRCTFDEDTKCQVCVCSDAMIDQGNEPPPGQPPFPNH